MLMKFHWRPLCLPWSCLCWISHRPGADPWPYEARWTAHAADWREEPDGQLPRGTSSKQFSVRRTSSRQLSVRRTSSRQSPVRRTSRWQLSVRRTSSRQLPARRTPCQSIIRRNLTWVVLVRLRDLLVTIRIGIYRCAVVELLAIFCVLMLRDIHVHFQYTHCGWIRGRTLLP